MSRPIRAHGGVIYIYSKEGQGTKFTIYLPVKQSGTLQAADKEADRLPSGTGETVLWVDDEVLILEMTCATLELYG